MPSTSGSPVRNRTRVEERQCRRPVRSRNAVARRRAAAGRHAQQGGNAATALAFDVVQPASTAELLGITAEHAVDDVIALLVDPAGIIF